MSNNDVKYTEAFNELQQIASEIEQGEISIDELAEKVKRAAVLIRVCKAKLSATEEDVNTILRELDSASE
ncbi:MAG TPA: exodeoxyribonuclease VII small subunit [Chryseosolibacter sp.]